MRNPILSVTLILGLLAGCGTGEDPYAIQKNIKLEKLATCDQVTQSIRAMVALQARQRLDAQLESIKESRRATQMDAGIAMPGADASASMPPTTPPKTPGGPAAHTATNTQEDHVDEPDFVKNDGTRVFVLSGSKLFVAQTWPPTELKLVATLPLTGAPTQMFLDKNRVVVFSKAAVAGNIMATRMTALDVSKLTAPRVVSTWTVPGAYVSARRQGTMVRLVLRGNINLPKGVKTYVSQAYSLSGWQLEARFNQVKKDNARVINSTPMEYWLPKGDVKLADGSMAPLGYSCSGFYRPNASVALGLTSVVSLNLDLPHSPPRSVTVLGAAGTIYASQKALYLANAHYWPGSTVGRMNHTYLHKFATKGVTEARYVGSGGVDGTLLNQFAMGEYKGDLQLATTIRRVEQNQGWSQSQTTSRVTILREQAGRLVELGRTKELAKGERIYSVRFQGARGYVVTFRQVDPLFTMDLRDPRNPKVIGELKVPGFSTYMHPLDKNHLLTVGANGGSLNWSQGVKLTVFDVSDFAKPKEKFTLKVGTWNAQSEANTTHLAFNYFAERGLLAIPVLDYAPYQKYSGQSYWDRYLNQLRVYRVDTSKGIKEVGALDMADLLKTEGKPYYGYGAFPGVRRSIMAVSKAGEDFVYAIAANGMRVANLADLTKPLKTVTFK